MPRAFSRHRPLTLVALAISLLIGVVAAKVNSSGNLTVGVAATQVMIDYPDPPIVKRRALEQDNSTLIKHGELYSQLLTTQTALDAVARRLDIPSDRLSSVARLGPTVPLPLRQPESEPRASQIAASRAPYRLELQSDPARSILYVYAIAPSGVDAERLANAAVAGLRDVLAGVAREEGFPAANLPTLRELEAPRGLPSNSKAKPVIAVFTFLVAFGVAAVVLLGLLPLLRRTPRRRAPVPTTTVDDWPHTNRLLPWGVAGFIVVLWLTPFDLIELSVPTPIDMKLDRLLLPPLALVWLLAFAAGGRGRPRLRVTPIHIAVAAFVAVAFVSVVLNARALNDTAELMLTLKRLPYLLAYVTLFLIVSTSVRPSEVHAFLTLTLVLAVIVAFGIIYELRFMTNMFRFIADKVAVGPFVFVGDSVQSVTVDSQGRRGISGPGLVGLEAVTMLALALPIVIVRLITARGRGRIVYGIVACILLAGVLATGRKSGLIAPVAVLATVGYFRRHELLKLAPVGLVIAIVVTAASPGTVRGILNQFIGSDRANVATTNDRVADYDAVRPDVWTHLLIGRGYGSYGHESYRLLDSEILARLIETGVIGLIAFLGLGVAVVLGGRRTIASRSQHAGPALVGASGGVVFIVAATLFDVTAFPHATYIFLSVAALASVAIGADQRPAPPPPAPAIEPPVLVDASPQPTHSLV